MASAGPTPQPGWYADPQSPAQLRFWDGTGWTAQTSPAPPPPGAAPGGQGWAQGPAQAQPGGFITSMFPPRPGERADDALVRGLASYERVSGYAWIAIGVLQVLLVLTIIAGAWNIYVGISRGKLASRIEQRDPYVPATFEPLTGYVISGVLNLVLGGVLGVALVCGDLYVRDQLLKSRHLFAGGIAPATPSGPVPSGPVPPGYAPGAPAFPPAPPTASGPEFRGTP